MPWLRPRHLALLATLAATAQVARFVDPTYHIDDAWISFRIARNWAEAGIPTFNLDAPPVEGMTNLSWTALVALLLRLAPDADPLIATRTLGAGLYLATVAGATALAAARAPTHPRLAAGLTGLLLVTQGNLAYHAVSGLETPLWAFLILASAALLGSAHGWLLGLTTGLLAATRPEGFLFGPVLLALHAWVCPAPDRTTTRPRGVPAAIVVFALIAGGVESWRLLTYGELVPNTAHAKTPSLEFGLESLRDWGLGLGGLGLLAALPARGSARWTLAAVAFVGVSVAATVASGGDWMIGHRRFVAEQVLLAILGGVAAAGAATTLTRIVHRWMVPGAWVVGGLVAAARAEDGKPLNPFLLTSIAGLLEKTPGVRSVAAVDIGQIGWYWRGHLLDLAGLVEPEIAHRPGGLLSKQWDEAWFRARAPEIAIAWVEIGPGGIDVRSDVEHDLLTSIHQNGGYTFHVALRSNDSGGYVIYRRNDVPLPVDVWGEPQPDPLARR